MKLKFKEEDESASFELESNSSDMSDDEGMKVEDLTNQKKKRKRVRKKLSKQGSMIKSFRASKTKFKKK